MEWYWILLCYVLLGLIITIVSNTVNRQKYKEKYEWYINLIGSIIFVFTYPIWITYGMFVNVKKIIQKS